MAGSSGDAGQKTITAANLREFIADPAGMGKENDVLHPHTAMANTDDDVLDVLDFLAEADLTDTQVYQAIRRKRMTRETTEAVRHGNISQMQYAVGRVDHAGDGRDALTACAKSLSYEGAIQLVFGPMGSGKTALMLDVAVVWRALTKGKVITNITSWRRADAYVSTDREMRREMANFEGPVLCVLDELAAYVSSRGEDSKAANNFAERLKWIRKDEPELGPYSKKGSVLAACHTEGDAAKPLRQLATGAIQKPDPKEPGRVVLKSSPGGEDSFAREGEFTGVTDTAESYGEHEASEFEIVPDGEDADGETRDTTEIVEETERFHAIATAINSRRPWVDWKNEEGSPMTHEEIATGPLGGEYSASWVGERLREWKNGEHSELVDRPDDAGDNS